MRTALVLALAAVLVGCVDGYPQKDAQLLDESAMTVPQLLTTLHAVSRRVPQAADFRYALGADCALHVDTGERTVTVPLAQAGVELLTRTLEGTQTWQLLARVPLASDEQDAAAAPLVVLLPGGLWADAVQARSLVAQLQRRCAVAPPTLRSPSGSDPR